jgi:23S rRNA (guanosine2251-2'-O)-methyltransferase
MRERLEGKQSILAALGARQRKIELILVSSGAHPDKIDAVLDLAQVNGVPVKTVSPEELNAAARGKTHGGLVAMAFSKPLTTVDDLFNSIKDARTASFCLLLEGVEDEQNLGFIFRTALATGVNAVLLKKHIWAFDPVKISRLSAGAYEWLPLVKVEKSDEILAQLKKQGLRIYGAVANARKSLYDIDFTGPVIITLGGEKRGISGAVRALCSGFFHIPMKSHHHLVATKDKVVESLSLSHASAIIMAEVMRQRYVKDKPGV